MPFGISFVRVTGPPCPQICGTSTFEECKASTVPLSRISRLARGAVPPSGGAACVICGAGREQEANRIAYTETAATRIIEVIVSGRLDAGTREMVDRIFGSLVREFWCTVFPKWITPQ